MNKFYYEQGIIAEREYQDNILKINAEKTNELIGMVGNYLGNVMDLYSQNISDQLEVLEQEKEYELGLYEGNEEKQGEIAQKYAKKEAQLKTKKAIADKASSLTNAVINTALGITSALTLPPPLSFVMAALTGALGAAQIAVIASKPIPQFAKGTDNAPEGPALVAERGRELEITPSGEISLLTKPQVKSLKKGTRIIPNEETEKILKAGGGGADSSELLGVIQAIREGNDKLIKTVRDKRELTIIAGKNKIIERRGSNYYKEYLNAKIYR